jgi:hypothetical protein
LQALTHCPVIQRYPARQGGTHSTLPVGIACGAGAACDAGAEGTAVDVALAAAGDCAEAMELTNPIIEVIDIAAT